MCRYQCHECDRQFDKPDVIKETHGFKDGSYEEFGVCPYCKGFYEEVFQCKICGEYFTEDELTSGVCDDCIYQHDTDIELLYRLGNEEDAKETVKLNGFIASVFTEEMIAEILMQELRRLPKNHSVNCIEFIGSDKLWFAEKLLEIKEEEDAKDF